MAFTKRPQPHIVLYRGEEVINRHAWSPFVVKLETRLRMSGLAYKTDFGSFQEAPKGKVPYVRVWWDEKSSSGNEKSQDESKDMDKNAADMIPDSTIIIKRFVGEGLLEDLNANLGPADQAYDLALRALLEDKFYFLQAFELWNYHVPEFRDHYLSWLPFPLRHLLAYMIYRGAKSGLNGQGTGRLTYDEVTAARQEICKHLNGLLSDRFTVLRKRSQESGGDKFDESAPFWLFDKKKGESQSTPSEADISLFAFIAETIVNKGLPQARKDMEQYPVILDYARRIHDRYFPDFQKWD